LKPGFIAPIDVSQTPGEPIKMSALSSNNNYENMPNRPPGMSSNGEFKTFDKQSYVENGGQVNLSMIS
jgi:hypothetical protein